MENSFNYTFTERDPYLVISLKGALTRACADEVIKCGDLALSKKLGYVVLDFQDVAKIEIGAVAAVVRLQKVIRDSCRSLKLCNLRYETGELLSQKGALRDEEVCASLKEALAEQHRLHRIGE